jgi:hypothetical protein
MRDLMSRKIESIRDERVCEGRNWKRLREMGKEEG